MDTSQYIIMFVIFLVCGGIAGLSSGLLGAGGGLVMVPLSSWALYYHGTSIGVSMHVAIGTSLAVMIISSSMSVYIHNKQHNVRWHFLFELLAGLAIGAVIGSSLANYLLGRVLHLMFAIFALISALQMTLKLSPNLRHRIKSVWILSFYGVFVGALSSCLGIGGSIVNVPFYKINKMSMKECAATSSASAIPVAIVGVVVFLLSGLQSKGLPEGSVGYINIPILIALSLGSIFAARGGAKLANRAKESTMRWIFAAFVGVIGIVMLVEYWTVLA